jgi:glycosyltransferase involved in cell wall biosynthesis
VTGYLVPLNDIEAMAAGGIQLLEHPAQAAQMGQAIRQRALDITDPAAIQANEHAAFDAVLSRSRP